MVHQLIVLYVYSFLTYGIASFVYMCLLLLLL